MLKTKKIAQALRFPLTVALAFLCSATAHATPLSLQNASITATYYGAASGMLGLDTGSRRNPVRTRLPSIRLATG